jgi:hypothetical protein
MNWHLVYDLAEDVRHVAEVQRASEEPGAFGFPPNPLFGTPAWWREIGTGHRPVHVLEGKIAAIYWSSMGDWPEFRLRDREGRESAWTRHGDVRRYVQGLGAKIEYVMLARKPGASAVLGETAEVVLRIWVEQSERRSSGIAPGPGGIGHGRWPGGATFHYLEVPSETAATELLAICGGREVHAYSITVGGRLIVRVDDGLLEVEELHDRQEVLRQLVEERGGVYDDCEIVMPR